jgi:hypothetical protein
MKRIDDHARVRGDERVVLEVGLPSAPSGVSLNRPVGSIRTTGARRSPVSSSVPARPPRSAGSPSP